MKIIARLLALIAFSVGLSWLGVAIFMFAYTEPDPIPQATTVVVLSGPGGEVPGTGGETRERVEAGIRAWREASALRIVMSGDGAAPGATTHARHMADHAISQGVPEAEILLEAESGSTLQNAWFTAELDAVDPAMPVIVVSHRYHLPRAWASFRFAGFKEVIVVAADTGPPEITEPVLMEGIKWPLNLTRATVAWLAMALGTDAETVLPWLR